MRSKEIPQEEQLRLVAECRNSGLSDRQWCLQHGIGVSTFSNWVWRNKKKGFIIPDPVGAEEYWPEAKPDIVQVNLVPEAKIEEKEISVSAPQMVSQVSNDSMNAMPSWESNAVPTLEMELCGARIRISNDINPTLLAHVLQMLRGGVAAC